ncbi:conserved hypothetical protein [Neospora caninum Liverpool]|uniref:Uncharacterized protein n=1 Tax=Neospora caninum (strain Liverpool) TaxID=572307 RepID=F0VE78_NEOCL|nr:conserved hypothetical protein [Neospora caninum Liverpool]CBZ52022.1 conserved hypothetical protein [Neospora caninum Liverpool]|eukprot:XP_003882054.1 conserved hypothetical protein [Neospora caninum Liverpool]
MDLSPSFAENGGQADDNSNTENNRGSGADSPSPSDAPKAGESASGATESAGTGGEPTGRRRRALRNLFSRFSGCTFCGRMRGRAAAGDAAAQLGEAVLTALEGGAFDQDLLGCIKIAPDMFFPLAATCRSLKVLELKASICINRRKNLADVLTAHRELYPDSIGFIRNLVLPVSHPAFVLGRESPQSELDIEAFALLVKNAVEKRPITPGTYSIFDDASNRSCVATQMTHKLKDCPLKASEKKSWRLGQLAAALYPPHADALDLRLLLSVLDLSDCKRRWEKRPVILVQVPGREKPVEVPKKLATHLLLSAVISRAYSANESDGMRCRRDGELTSKHEVSCRRLKQVNQMRRIVQAIFESVLSDDLSEAQTIAGTFAEEWRTSRVDDSMIERVNKFVVGHAFADIYAFLEEKLESRGTRMLRFLIRMKLTKFLTWYVARLVSKLSNPTRPEAAAVSPHSDRGIPNEVLNAASIASAAHLACGGFENWVQKFAQELVFRVLKRHASTQKTPEKARTAFIEKVGASDFDSEIGSEAPKAASHDNGRAAASPTESASSFLGVNGENSPEVETEPQETMGTPLTTSLASGVLAVDKVISSSKIRRSIAQLLTVLIVITLAADFTLPDWFPGSPVKRVFMSIQGREDFKPHQFGRLGQPGSFQQYTMDRKKTAQAINGNGVAAGFLGTVVS